MRLHDTLLGLLIMALATAFFVHAMGFPAMPGQRYGPSLFPQILAVGIFVCGLVTAVRGWRSGAPWLRVDPLLREPRRLVSFLSMPLAVGFYLLAAERLGFLPTAAVVVTALAWWFGVRWWKAVVLGVACAWGVYFFFGQLMRVPLPRGWFMQVFFGG